MSKNAKIPLFLAIFLVFSLFFSLGVKAFQFSYLAPEGSRYFVKTTSAFWQKNLNARHIFDNGFSVDLSGIQLALVRIFKLEIEPIQQYHILPPQNLVEIKNSKIDIERRTNIENTEIRFLPSDQTPWGIEVIYNNPAIKSTSGGEGVNVAVLDTGVLKTHPDLKNRIGQCKDFTNPRVPVKDGTCDDKNGHGTHVSGTILADGGSDKLGIYGIAPQATLFAYKVCGNDGSCWADDIAMAIRVASDNKVNIINLSLGADKDDPLIRQAIDYAVSSDVLVIGAAGNDGPYPESIDYPAANKDVVAVGAIDFELVVPEWSSRGINSKTTPYLVEEKDIEFGAPGVNIESTWKNGGYAILSGTSMATPHISGLAAKVWQFNAQEGTRAQATRGLLHQLADDIWLLGDDDATGFGLPNLGY